MKRNHSIQEFVIIGFAFVGLMALVGVAQERGIKPDEFIQARPIQKSGTRLREHRFAPQSMEEFVTDFLF